MKNEYDMQLMMGAIALHLTRQGRLVPSEPELRKLAAKVFATEAMEARFKSCSPEAQVLAVAQKPNATMEFLDKLIVGTTERLIEQGMNPQAACDKVQNAFEAMANKSLETKWNAEQMEAFMQSAMKALTV